MEGPSSLSTAVCCMLSCIGWERERHYILFVSIRQQKVVISVSRQNGRLRPPKAFIKERKTTSEFKFNWPKAVCSQALTIPRIIIEFRIWNLTHFKFNIFFQYSKLAFANLTLHSFSKFWRFVGRRSWTDTIIMLIIKQRNIFRALKITYLKLLILYTNVGSHHVYYKNVPNNHTLFSSLHILTHSNFLVWFFDYVKWSWHPHIVALK